MRNQFFLVWAVFFLVTGCASEQESGTDNVVEEEDVSLNPLDQLDVISVDVTDVEAPEPDVEEEDGDDVYYEGAQGEEAKGGGQEAAGGSKQDDGDVEDAHDVEAREGRLEERRRQN